MNKKLKLIIFILLCTFLLITGSYGLQNQKALDESFLEAQESFEKVIDTQQLMIELIIELCSDSHNKSICDKYEVVITPQEKTN